MCLFKILMTNYFFQLIQVLFKLKNLNKFARSLNQNLIVKKRIRFQRFVGIRNFIIIGWYNFFSSFFFIKRNLFILFLGFFFFSWSPYAFISMYNAFIDSSQIETLTTLVPSKLAKSTLFWTSFIYMIFDTRILRKVLKLNFQESHNYLFLLIFYSIAFYYDSK